MYNSEKRVLSESFQKTGMTRHILLTVGQSVSRFVLVARKKMSAKKPDDEAFSVRCFISFNSTILSDIDYHSVASSFHKQTRFDFCFQTDSQYPP